MKQLKTTYKKFLTEEMKSRKQMLANFKTYYEGDEKKAMSHFKWLENRDRTDED